MTDENREFKADKESIEFMNQFLEEERNGSWDLFDQMEIINCERVLKELENTKTSELCRLLGTVGDEQLPIDDTADLYLLYENKNSTYSHYNPEIPIHLKNKIKEHFDSCPSCKQVYERYGEWQRKSHERSLNIFRKINYILKNSKNN